MAYLYNLIQPRLTLGLSGTHYRTDRIKLCFDKVIRDAGIGRLIQDGYLSRYHHYTIPEYTPESVAASLVRSVFDGALHEPFAVHKLFAQLPP